MKLVEFPPIYRNGCTNLEAPIGYNNWPEFYRDYCSDVSVYDKEIRLLIGDPHHQFREHVVLAHEIAHIIGYYSRSTKFDLPVESKYDNEVDAWRIAIKLLKGSNDWDAQSRKIAVKSLGTYDKLNDIAKKDPTGRTKFNWIRAASSIDQLVAKTSTWVDHSVIEAFHWVEDKSYHWAKKHGLWISVDCGGGVRAYNLMKISKQ